MKDFSKKQPGYYLPIVLTFAAIVLLVSTAIITLAYSNFHLISSRSRSNSALNIAEAGINYYLWHLSHNNQDYCDGNAPCTGAGPFGPYVKEYRDTTGAIVGTYSITITPPPANGTSATVRAVGTTSSGEKRTVVATLGVPSFAQYSFVTNSQTWFGDTENTVGLVHSNSGIRFDGTASGVVSSAVSSYVPSGCFGGDGQTHNGVWGSGGPTSYWNFPVPQVNFNQLTSDLNALQTAAQTNGMFLPTLVGNNGNKTYDGYVLQLNANNTVLVGKVTGKQDNGSLGGSCAKHNKTTSLIQSISWEATPRALPANGIIFVSDNVWVWGTVSARLTVASGRFPDTAQTNTNVFLQNDIIYPVKDGSVALGIIAQADIIVNSDSEDNLELDAYLLSQKGKVFRPYYSGSNCNNCKTQITVYGGIAPYAWWTWSWVNGSNTVISGYRNTTQIYDNYLALNPPPLFPKTGSYAILSWKEEPIL